jgi:hypothetical protein
MEEATHGGKVELGEQVKEIFTSTVLVSGYQDLRMDGLS